MDAPMVAVAVVRDGVLPAGADECVAECGGRAILVGTGVDTACDQLATIAGEVRLVEHPVTGPATLATLLAPLLLDEAAVVLPGSPDGRDLAPRLAAELRRPLYAGALTVQSGRVDLSRRGGTEIHRVSPSSAFVATLQPGVRGVSPGSTDTDTTPTRTVVAAPAVAAGIDAEPRGVLPPDPATLDLGEAERIVAGGAGLDGPERIGQLARVGVMLGASAGATRVVTDRGWTPHERQIGTTGVVVAPRLYLAFGISGAVQHTSGLGDPEHVVTVNTDAHCPMMQLADLAITADANQTLDHLERLLGGSS